MTISRRIIRLSFASFLAASFLAGSLFVVAGRAEEETQQAKPIEIDVQAFLAKLDPVIARTDDPQAKSALMHMRVIAQQSAPSLELTACELAYIPREIGFFRHLTNLDLDDNHLTELPQEIGDLTNLTRLDLNTNCLSTLPEEIQRFMKLRELNLNSNLFTELPSEFRELENLTTLWINANKLVEFPEEIV